MKKIINDENKLDQMTNANVVLGTIQSVIRVAMINTVKMIKLRKAAGPSELNAEMIITSDNRSYDEIVPTCSR